MPDKDFEYEEDFVLPPGVWVHIPKCGVDVIQSTNKSQFVTAFKSKVDGEYRVMHSGYPLGMRLHKNGS